jgi:exonuclease VII small subunit
MPMPAIASDRLVELHNDLTHYDMAIAGEMREYLRGHDIDTSIVKVDVELEESLRAFKAEMPAEVECRRELLRYKRRIDDVVRELLRLQGEKVTTAE